MIVINTDLKRWTVLDLEISRPIELTDKEFGEGVKKEHIKLRGKFIMIDGQKIWIDGVVKENKKLNW